MEKETDIRYMRQAIEEARAALQADEVPIGAVIVADNHIIGRGHNLTETLGDVTAHAEMLAITAATQTLGGKYLRGATIYVTVEPCLMCAGAIAWSQLSRVVYGASDPKRGFSSYITTPPAHSPQKSLAPLNYLNSLNSFDSLNSLDSRDSLDSRNSPITHPFHPKTTVTTGILADECSALMQQFFRSKRKNSK